MARHSFTGFSTSDTERSGQWRYHDDALIHRDLMNHFKTRIGERRMRPEWGCRIPEFLMEPMTEINVGLIYDEAVRICEADPRVLVETARVLEFDNAVRVEIDLRNRMTQVVSTFSVNFEARETARMSAENY